MDNVNDSTIKKRISILDEDSRKSYRPSCVVEL